MAKDFMLLFIEYLRCFTVKDSIQHTHSGANMYMCIYVCLCAYTNVCAYGYSYGLIDMRIYVFVSASACSPFLSDILTRPQYFFISFTLLIVLSYCYVLWCCTFVTGQPLTLIKMMNYILSNNFFFLIQIGRIWCMEPKFPWITSSLFRCTRSLASPCGLFNKKN